jgi:3-oxoacyl-(acyl-carrier-protein) synthase
MNTLVEQVGTLRVLARAEWDGGELPQVAGFVVSSFNPLVAEVARRCLVAYFGEPPADPAIADGVAVVLVSERGDTGTADALAEAVRTGRRVQPLLFFQSNPNAIVGHVTSRWGLGGPVVCVNTGADPLTEGLAVADLLIEDGDAVAALVVAADQGDEPGVADRAVAVLVARNQ